MMGWQPVAVTIPTKERDLQELMFLSYFSNGLAVKT
jgi:hypothetical protein